MEYIIWALFIIGIYLIFHEVDAPTDESRDGGGRWR